MKMITRMKTSQNRRQSPKWRQPQKGRWPQKGRQTKKGRWPQELRWLKTWGWPQNENNLLDKGDWQWNNKKHYLAYDEDLENFPQKNKKHMSETQMDWQMDIQTERQKEEMLRLLCCLFGVNELLFICNLNSLCLHCNHHDWLETCGWQIQCGWLTRSVSIYTNCDRNCEIQFGQR